MSQVLLVTTGVFVGVFLLLVMIGMVTHVITSLYFRNRLTFLLSLASLEQKLTEGNTNKEKTT